MGKLLKFKHFYFARYLSRPQGLSVNPFLVKI
jgi:hypothetical protein